MKKSILIPMLLVAVFAVSNSFAQISFGVKGSFNMQNINVKDINDKKVDGYKIAPKFDAGVFAEFNIADEFFVRPELLFAAKGSSRTITGLGTTEYKTNMNYIQVPVYFLYKGDLGSGKMLVGVGPYFAYGFGGKIKTTTTVTGLPETKTETDIKFKNDITILESLSLTPYYKPLDFGANVMAGYELSNGISASLVASLGLNNIEPKVAGNKPDFSTKNIGFGVSLGYRFGR